MQCVNFGLENGLGPDVIVVVDGFRENGCPAAVGARLIGGIGDPDELELQSDPPRSRIEDG
jgi:hypothetical protein